ncbi:VOC family protein [Rhodococcus sp. ABRD24]|uniref:VOC family protein n=1 Tax=Rhodococcus sp. ABRD24 TaxID=2507582 RepID=UPI00103C27AE|nr:VOC family protein [Rhodococcus sp. ABRD24]QBJ97329.1 VOC family protein [Rhodococcus sp. ABRD24]
MGYEIQVTVDSANPHAQAKWWARALGWQVEPSDEQFIRGLVAAGHARESDTLVFEGVLVWREGAAISDPEHPQQPRILFQLVPEGKSVKNRLHLDLRVGDRREEVAEELAADGASILHRGQQGPSVWITMADPEGNEFCVG